MSALAGVRNLKAKCEAIRRAKAVLKAQAQSLSAHQHRNAIAEAREQALLLEAIESDLEDHDRDLKQKAAQESAR